MGTIWFEVVPSWLPLVWFAAMVSLIVAYFLPGWTLSKYFVGIFAGWILLIPVHEGLHLVVARALRPDIDWTIHMELLSGWVWGYGNFTTLQLVLIGWSPVLFLGFFLVAIWGFPFTRSMRAIRRWAVAKPVLIGFSVAMGFLHLMYILQVLQTGAPTLGVTGFPSGFP